LKADAAKLDGFGPLLWTWPHAKYLAVLRDEHSDDEDRLWRHLDGECARFGTCERDPAARATRSARWLNLPAAWIAVGDGLEARFGDGAIKSRARRLRAIVDEIDGNVSRDVGAVLADAKHAAIEAETLDRAAALIRGDAPTDRAALRTGERLLAAAVGIVESGAWRFGDVERIALEAIWALDPSLFKSHRQLDDVLQDRRENPTRSPWPPSRIRRETLDSLREEIRAQPRVAGRPRSSGDWSWRAETERRLQCLVGRRSGRALLALVGVARPRIALLPKSGRRAPKARA
jgi:hypothetical protein